MPTREETQSLAQEIVRSYEDRVSGIAQLRQTVKTQLKELDDAHKSMSTQLRADLAKGEEERLREAGALKHELVRGVAERKSAVSAQLKELDDAHKGMSNQLRTDLAKGEEQRLADARALKGELVRGVAERKSAVNAQLKELAGIQAGARDEWRKLTATMQAKRGMPVVTVAPEVPEVTPEMAELRNRVFAYLADHPDGTRMTEMEQAFGLSRIQMARVIRSLADENKVEKRDLLYFAI